jgi:hypothetical protein
LKNNRTSPNTTPGIINRFITWIIIWSRMRSTVWARILVRNDRPDIKKIKMTAPMISNKSVSHSIVECVCFVLHLPHLTDHSALMYPPFFATSGNCQAKMMAIAKPSRNQYFDSRVRTTDLTF